MNRPIVSIPNGAIEDVCKIKIKKDPFLCKKDMDENEKKLFDHMFEIYLREDYEDVFVYRDEEAKVVQEIKRCVSRPRSARVEIYEPDNRESKLNLDISRILFKSVNLSRAQSTRSFGRENDKLNET